jgi:cytochrome c biogenesis protein CcmG, thiol:disulfide interchange protein DsbE
MSRTTRPLAVLLAAGLALGLLAGPVLAAKQEVGSRVKVQGARLPAPRPDTFATSDDPAIGRTPPTLVGKGFNAKKVKIEPSTEPRIVVFLAHWCPHCQAEVPVIVELAEEGRLDGLQVDTIATSTSEERPNYPPSKWLKRERWPFKPVLADDARSRALVAFGGTSFPYFVFVAADGTVAGRWSGELGASGITEIAERLVAGRSLFE